MFLSNSQTLIELLLGFTLIELLVVIAIIAILAVSQSSQLRTTTDMSP
ncbi:MAG: prepilin-type N-terminal cleavage/methylation domain-containing protein [Verrucomicrobia bacterium]|nr:prepilin-type N-terminal cleavage/methylation domain-containing protein [Verrucomicrobiota bacterium]